MSDETIVSAPPRELVVTGQTFGSGSHPRDTTIVGSPDVSSAAQGRDTLPSSSGPSGGPPPGDGFWGSRQIPQEHAKVFDYAQTVLSANRVRPEIGSRGMDVLLELKTLAGALPPDQPRHQYDVSRFSSKFQTPDDKAELRFFLNKLADAGARQPEVDAFLSMVVDMSRIAAKRGQR